jgi:outer membrane protein assembly factor BamB
MRIRTACFSFLLVAALAVPAAAELTPANVGGIVLKWDVPTMGPVTGGPVVVDGVVYVGSWSGDVRALDALTGAERWLFAAGGAVSGPVHLSGDGKVCFGTLAAKVFCLNAADGTLVWERTLAMGPDAVWSNVVTANGRLFVGIASLLDNPCTKGRVVALELATGMPLWTFQTVPDKICSTDTAIACTGDGECGAGTCIDARGGGVTASPIVDPTGNFVYFNSVGCYTFPSVGESDSIFKLDATNGEPIWRRRVSPPEQFGSCAMDTAVECSTDAQCAGVGGTCTNPKLAYHDFGFVNGPIRIEVPADGGGTETLIVSGSKNGTLYALHESDGMIAWENPVVPTPVSPGFAGFGFFNGALAHAEGRIHAALGNVIPSRVCSNDPRRGCTTDAQCPGGTCPPEPEHLAAFDATNGALLWSDEIGRSWSSVAVVNGVVYAGTNRDDPMSGASEFFANDAANGARLATLPLPATSAARAAVAGDSLYVGYGTDVGGAGGVRAFSLCGNGQLDPGETCDPEAAQCCSPSCTVAGGTACDDGDACTTGDQCADSTCAGQIATLEALGCVLGVIDDQPCGDEALPAGLGRKLGNALGAVDGLLDKAAGRAAGKPAKLAKIRRAILRKLTAIERGANKAARSRRESRRISEGCKTAVTERTARGRTLVEAFVF